MAPHVAPGVDMLITISLVAMFREFKKVCRTNYVRAFGVQGCARRALLVSTVFGIRVGIFLLTLCDGTSQCRSLGVLNRNKKPEARTCADNCGEKVNLWYGIDHEAPLFMCLAQITQFSGIWERF